MEVSLRPVFQTQLLVVRKGGKADEVLISPKGITLPVTWSSGRDGSSGRAHVHSDRYCWHLLDDRC